jgi:hypothetical protein
MRYWELRRLLDDIERAANRWRMVEALSLRRGADWQAVVVDADTGLWHTLREYADLTAPRATLPPGASPPSPRDLARLDRLDGRPAHDSGQLSWRELLSVVDGVVAAPGWELFWFGRTHRDPECHQVYVYDVADPAYRRAHWIDTIADWAQLRDGELLAR